MNTWIASGILVSEVCCHEDCNMRFAMDSEFQKQRKEDHKSFYCPRGHSQYYAGKSDKEKLQEHVDQLERQKMNLNTVIDAKNRRIEQLGYSVRAQKAARTKIMNRVKNGVCPCCNRQFSDLQHHFKSKHPELLEKR